MRSNSVRNLVLTIIFVLVILVISIVYETRATHSKDYVSHTTPLSETVVRDICEEFGLKASEYCQEDVTVYAPEFFDEIEEYFMNIAKRERTIAQVVGLRPRRDLILNLAGD